MTTPTAEKKVAAAPVAAKVKKPKGPTRAERAGAALAKGVAARVAPKPPSIHAKHVAPAAIARGVDPALTAAANPSGRADLVRRPVLKEDYNHATARLRNTAVEHLHAPEDKAGRSKLRALLKPYRHYVDLRTAIIQNYSPQKFEDVMLKYFDPLDELRLKADWEKKVQPL